LPLSPGEVSRSDGEGAFLTEEGGFAEGKTEGVNPRLFLFSADAAFTFYTPRAGGAHPLPGAAKDAKRP